MQAVKQRHASSCTVYHALYGYYFLGLSRAKLAFIYGKHRSTISNWITTYEQQGSYGRIQNKTITRKFGIEKRRWLVDLYKQKPLLYLHEAGKLFEDHFRMKISASSICRILHSEGLTWKCLERRAIQVRQDDVYRFFMELNSLPWDYSNLLFLDEVSFDNRGMLRNRGYAEKGKRLICRGEFVRKPRVSCLCMIGQNGMLECSYTEGTFTRLNFFHHIRQFALQSDKVETYPGIHSIWILDGARIHCDASIISYLRSLGIYPIFLPAYTPFYNPIEIVFGTIKRRAQQDYKENDTRDLKLFISEIMTSFYSYKMDRLFRKCGYINGGKFDPTVASPENIIDLGFEENSHKRKTV